MGTPNVTAQGPPTLNRWLNVNLTPRNRRTRGFLNLTSDTLVPNPEDEFGLYPASWNGSFSEKCLQINVITTQKFSLLPIPLNDAGQFPLLGGYVQWTVARFIETNSIGNNIYTRYKLNNTVGYTRAADQVYNGQVLGLSVAFEAWTVPISTFQFSSFDAVGFLTSILSQTVDVRSGYNFALNSSCGAHGLFHNTSAGDATVGYNLPMTFPLFLFFPANE